MNLLIITQKVDDQDDLLGFFVEWIREFANHFEKIYVITLAKGNYTLPNNVTIASLGKEKKRSKFVQAFLFFWHSFKFTPKVDGVFAHMSPIFAIAAWPLAVIFRKKILLWYLHRSVTLRLRVAEKLSYKVVTAVAESLKFKSNKIVEVGHGINLDKFIKNRQWAKKENEPWRILSVGRISPIKNYETLIDAGKLLRGRGVSFVIKIIGRPVMPGDSEYMKQLKLRVKDAGLEKLVNFSGFVPYSEIQNYYFESDIVVNLTPTGGIDKTILEAMAAGSITLASNAVFNADFGTYAQSLLFYYGNPKDLADKIEKIISLPSQEKEKISLFLRENVSRQHKLSKAIGSITSLLQ